MSISCSEPASITADKQNHAQKLLFRLVFARELKKMATARQELEQLSHKPVLISRAKHPEPVTQPVHSSG